MVILVVFPKIQKKVQAVVYLFINIVVISSKIFYRNTIKTVFIYNFRLINIMGCRMSKKIFIIVVVLLMIMAISGCTESVDANITDTIMVDNASDTTTLQKQSGNNSISIPLEKPPFIE